MNRAERRAKLALTKRYIRRGNRSLSDDFVEVPRSSWPAESDPLPAAVYRSKRFLVQAFNERDGIVRLSICRTALDASGEWLARITWEELQAVKNGVGYAEHDAVEVYPRAQDVVNVSNMRHLWIMPEHLKYAWRVATFVSYDGKCL